MGSLTVESGTGVVGQLRRTVDAASRRAHGDRRQAARYSDVGCPETATGKALDLPAVQVWDVRDGKLARFRQFIDAVKFAEVVPVPAAV
jgi:ketosteroid isomerase-like protein